MNIRNQSEYRVYSLQIGKLLDQAGQTVSIAESCTGGLLGHQITNSPGSSAYFRGGIIAYDNRIKVEKLGVDQKRLEKFGAVSEEVAKEMAKNVRQIFKTDYGVAITGIAGPDGGTKKKPVGLVFVAISNARQTVCKKCQFFGARPKIKSQAAHQALKLLFESVRAFSERNFHG